MDEVSIKSSITFEKARALFKQIMRSMGGSDHPKFLKFIEDNWHPSEFCHSEGSTPEAEFLKKIAKDIRSSIPFNAILPSESILPPTKGENSDCIPSATIHVDGFLYDDDEVNELIDTEEIQSNYCAECGSKNIRPCVMISHSMSVDALDYIFNSILPNLRGKTVLDVGSRLGAVLYGAHVFSSADRIIGVEMNADLCKLQTDIVCKYEMEDRIEIICKKIEDCPDIVQESDVIILNNVFEFYQPEAVHIEIWRFLRANIRKGTILVTRPHLETTFKQINTGIVLTDWVKLCESDEKLEVGSECSNDFTGNSLNFPDISCYEVI